MMFPFEKDVLDKWFWVEVVFVIIESKNTYIRKLDDTLRYWFSKYKAIK